MSTSGINTYQISRDTIITAALRKLGVIASGQSPATEDITNGSLSLNTLLAELRGIGMPLWARTTFSFNPTLSTNSYTIGNGYTLNTPYPIRILEAFRIDSGGTTKIPIEIKGSVDFNMLPLTLGGPPLQLMYQPGINVGTLKIWPTPDSSAITSSITIIYQRPFEYFNGSTEWYNGVIYRLAVLLAPEWGIPLPDRQLLKKEADEYLANAMMSEQEDGSFTFSPRRNRG